MKTFTLANVNNFACFKIQNSLNFVKTLTIITITIF